jgi:hypothetical protein
VESKGEKMMTAFVIRPMTRTSVAVEFSSSVTSAIVSPGSKAIPHPVLVNNFVAI